MASKTGRFAIIEQLRADGIDRMFGNPGTVEEGFLDSLESYPDFKYVLALHESVAIGIADGYARATKKPTVVQLHSGVGLGNAIGMLYQAKRGHAPLVVLNGDAGVAYDAMDAQMACDPVAMAQPVTKWATRVTHPAALLRVLRRAIKIAATPPMGPVFVCLPMDVLDAVCAEPVVPTSFIDTRVTPGAEQIARVAQVLAAATHPLIIMGDGVAAAGAQDELARVAEATGAEVWGADSSEVNLSATHPLYRGLLGHMFGDHSRAITSRADVVLICGTYVFPEVFPALSDVFAPGATVVHIDLDPWEIAKNFPVDIALLGDPRTTLASLGDALATQITAAQQQAAQARVREIGAAQATERRAQLAADQQQWGSVPLSAAQFMEQLGAQLPPDAIVFDEALTSSPELCRYVPPTVAGQYFQTRGGSLGVGIPGAIGLKLAHPDKTVIGLTGDGGSMYTIQALWTAAHYGIDAKFVVCNNKSYRLLKLNIQQYWQAHAQPEHAFPASFDITAPDIQFHLLAQSMGVRAVRVETPEEIAPAIRQALAHSGPFLIDVVLANEVPGHPTSIKCGQ